MTTRYSTRAALSAVLLILIVFLTAPCAIAQDKGKGGPPPSPVVVAKAVAGKVTPTLSFIGTIEFPEVSNLAAEVSGRVDKVHFEEGQRVQKGQALVVMDTALLRRQFTTAKWAVDEGKVVLELAKKDLARMQELIKSSTITQQDYDQAFTDARKLEFNYRGLEATMNRLADEIAKATIRAPFDGVVLGKSAVRGEWLAPGTQVAVIARDESVDVVINVPQHIWAQAKPGLAMEVEAAGKTFPGVIHAAIAQGDVSTRTFPVKVRAKNIGNLAQGMQAQVRLPSGMEVEAIIVSRDAVVSSQGQTTVFTVANGTASPVPVQVLRYDGMNAAVRGPGLEGGMEVVVKGNERLRPGQAVAATLQE